jgi:hypothetical protein
MERTGWPMLSYLMGAAALSAMLWLAAAGLLVMIFRIA